MTAVDGTGPAPGAEAAACPRCGSPVFEDERFCEACGTSVTPEPVPEPDRAPVPAAEADPPVELDLEAVGAVTHRGYRRARNEDAVAGAAGTGWSAAVVCDGVASTSNAHLASGAAVHTALAVLEAGAAAATDDTSAALVVRSLVEAQAAVSAVAPDAAGGLELAPSTTAVVVLILGSTLHVAGVGDSRAYWLGKSGAARILTTDDSLARDRIAEGVPVDVAYADPDAHTITRWLGADADAAEPVVSSFPVTEPGVVVVCTDGLWNYVEAPERMLDAAGDWTGMRPLDVAHRLVDVALDAGGQDNVTVAVLPVGGTAPSVPADLP